MNSKRIWLSICAILVFAIVVVGGYTRLTHSGLSIVEWKPISGVIPPLNELSWEKEFALYKKSPEFQKVNFNMNISEFKEIFFVEYFHRMIGRLIGIAFLIPLLYFYYTKNLSSGEKKSYLTIGSLILLQGIIGWLMVKSGLSSNPYVSHYRLAIHLCMACLILSLICWNIIPGKPNITKHGLFSILILFLQIFSGALVAGLHAGLVYNSFPLMNGALLPVESFTLKPLWKNFFENVTLVQFCHRSLGIINFVNLLAYSYNLFKLNELRTKSLLIIAVVSIQLLLGVFTLIMQVPLSLALLHQAFAVVLLITVLSSFKTCKDI